MNFDITTLISTVGLAGVLVLYFVRENTARELRDKVAQEARDKSTAEREAANEARAKERENRMADRMDKFQEEFTKCRRETMERSIMMDEKVCFTLEKLCTESVRQTKAIETAFFNRRSTDHKDYKEQVV